jgi:hypothetical protein
MMYRKSGAGGWGEATRNGTFYREKKIMQTITLRIYEIVAIIIAISISFRVERRDERRNWAGTKKTAKRMKIDEHKLNFNIE